MSRSTKQSRASAREPRPRHTALRGRRLLCVALVGAIISLAGCGGRAVDRSSGDINQGKQLFVQTCGGCHTLRDAATLGTVGPNLDDAFHGAREKTGGSFDESTFFQITLDQMRLASPPMPDYDNGPQKLPEDQLISIAAYVASVAGKESPAEGGTGTGTGTSTTGETSTGTTTGR
jgi:mono/diheme cytochrome c family protein